MKRQHENGCLKVKERGLRENQSCWNLDLELSASKTMGNNFLLFKAPSLRHFVRAALVNQYNTLLLKLWLLVFSVSLF